MSCPACSDTGWDQESVPWLLLFGLLCLVIVVLMHMAETLRVVPSTGWGLWDSPWRYLDLVSAILYGGALVCALVLRIAARNR